MSSVQRPSFNTPEDAKAGQCAPEKPTQMWEEARGGRRHEAVAGCAGLDTTAECKTGMLGDDLGFTEETRREQ